MKTEFADLALRQGHIVCTDPECPPGLHGEPAVAVAYESCPGCGELIVARCAECGGEQGCSRVLDLHIRTYHVPPRGCRS